MKLLIRYGELTLKKKNRSMFIDQLYQRIKNKLGDQAISFEKRHDRMFVTIPDDAFLDVKEKLLQIVGLHSLTIVHETEPTLDALKECALEVARLDLTERSMKVESKRGNKNFPMTSIEISREVASYVLINTEHLRVDVKQPDYVLHVELQRDGGYVYGEEFRGLGGLPYGSGGRGLLLLSGGIDSPVAAFQMMKRGMEVDLLHFESTPLTPIESVQKVVDLAKELAKFGPMRGMRLYLVPFKDLHLALLNNVDESYTITIMRRMMFRIAEQFAKKISAKALITGESLGQVASQTIESMETINDVVKIPVLRPLVGTDKEAIINISKEIKTYPVSIRPFEDCCTVYVPKKPVTKPSVKRALREEQFAYEELLQQAVEGIQVIRVKEDSEIDLPAMGLEMMV